MHIFTFAHVVTALCDIHLQLCVLQTFLDYDFSDIKSNESNLFYSQLADGIMGLGNSNQSFSSVYGVAIISHK